MVSTEETVSRWRPDAGRHLLIERRTIVFLLAAVFAFAACVGSDSTATDDPSGTTTSAAPPTTETTVAPATTQPAEPAPADKPPTPIVVQKLVVTGPEEVVFDWTTDRCEPEHIPDIAARAFRDASGNVQLTIGHYVNYRMVGPDFDSLVSDCTAPVLASDFDPDPSQFNDSEWIGALYTEDGQTVYAVVHNEYRGVTHKAARPGQCPSNDNLTCLDTSFTMAVSTDGGDTFRDIKAPPQHLIATLPFVFDDEGAPSGIRQPSNIVRGPDDYFYLFGSVIDYPDKPGDYGPQWVCALRTDDLTDPASWRYWDGAAFAGKFVNPYTDGDAAGHDAPKCAPVAFPELSGSINETVVYVETLDKYVMAGLNKQAGPTTPVWGVYYSLSEDLINWSPRELLLEIKSGEAIGDPANELLHAYPSIIDPDSPSLSFETMDNDAYLYISRFNFGGNSLDRDLLRFAIGVEDVVYDGPIWTFETDGDVERWFPEGGIGAFMTRDGTLTLESVTDDPYLVSGPTTIPASYDTAIIRMRVSSGADTFGQLFFVTGTDQGWNEAKSLVFDVVADGEFRDYTLDLSTLRTWNGLIEGLRIDPVAASGLTVDIDRISFPDDSDT